MFEHRHYTRIAAIIAELPEKQRPNIARHFALALRGTNPNYDRERFEDAANGSPRNGRDRVRVRVR